MMISPAVRARLRRSIPVYMDVYGRLARANVGSVRNLPRSDRQYCERRLAWLDSSTTTLRARHACRAPRRSARRARRVAARAGPAKADGPPPPYRSWRAAADAAHCRWGAS